MAKNKKKTKKNMKMSTNAYSCMQAAETPDAAASSFRVLGCGTRAVWVKTSATYDCQNETRVSSLIMYMCLCHYLLLVLT